MEDDGEESVVRLGTRRLDRLDSTSFLKPTILCLLATETAERFAFYGFRALLVLYLVQKLQYSESDAVAIYSYSNSLAYFTPLLGACLADGLWGRYNVIASFGSLYLAGLAIISVAALQDDSLFWKRSGSFAGLFLVCLGTGGIKPCVSAFGADQVDSATDVRAFFSYFYFCINVGALTSTAIVPIVQATMGFGVSFGVAACFMFTALVLFVSQRRSYKYVSAEGNMMDAFRIAVQRLFGDRYQTLLGQNIDDEIAVDGDSDRLVQDVFQTMQILPILALLPIYWCLYDQQGSVWTLQANRMHLPLGIQPAQLNIVNPLQIMMFIPVFDQIIYPFMERRGVDISPLRRMSWGMVFTAIAFLISACVESRMLHLERTNGPKLNVLYQLPQITILSIGEILLSITGLEYAYSSSATSLKTFVSALYLATSGLGNALSGLLFSTVFSNLDRATTMVVCAALMIANQIIFVRVALRSRQIVHSHVDGIEMRGEIT